MEKCQNCKTEYELNEVKCPKCGDENIRLKNNWAHLTTVSNDIEFGIISGMLHMGNIPTLRKPLGVDAVIGISISGIEIMVPKARYLEAIKLLDTQLNEELVESETKTT